MTDNRVKTLITRVRAQTIQTLSAMIGTDNAMFYTASDVATRLTISVGVDISALAEEDRRAVIQAVSGALSSAYRNKTNNVHRTRATISPKLYAGRASYGYRIGMAINEPVVTSDTINESKTNTAAYEHVMKNRYSTAEQLVSVMSWKELSDLELAIQARKEEIFHNTERQLMEFKRHERSRSSRVSHSSDPST